MFLKKNSIVYLVGTLKLLEYNNNFKRHAIKQNQLFQYFKTIKKNFLKD